MTLHLKRINGFGNGNGGGGGGSITDEIIVDGIAYDNKGDFNVSYSNFQGKFNGLKIDSPFFKFQLGYTSTNPGGGSYALTIYTTTFNGTNNFITATISSIPLYFGQTYTSQTFLSNVSCISPNKEFVVVCGVNTQKTSIFAVKLTKDGNNNYIFDTSFSSISIDTGVEGNTAPVFINNDTFVCFKETTVYVYQITNNTISFIKSISLDITYSFRTACNGLLVIGTSNKIEFIDISTENIVYTESSISYGGICVYENKVIFRNLGNVPFFIYDVTNGVVTKDNFTIGENTFYTTATSSDIVILKVDQNKVFVFCSCYSTTQCFQFAEINFNNNTITQLPVVGDFRLTSTGTYHYISCYFQDETTLYCYAAYQGGYEGSGATRYSFSYTPLLYQLTYDNKKYQFLSFTTTE